MKASKSHRFEIHSPSLEKFRIKLKKTDPHPSCSIILNLLIQDDMIQTKFQSCIEACLNCEAFCKQCAVACLNEKEVEHLRACIQLNLECAAICQAAANVMSFDGKFSKEICKLCVDICNACADECERHGEMGMEHCKECAEACRQCAKACQEMSQAA